MKYDVWHLLGGSSRWVEIATTKQYCIDIREFLRKKFETAAAQKKRKPKLSYSQIAKETGIKRAQVKTAVELLSMRDPPFVKVIADSYRTRKGGQIVHLVEFLR